MIALATPDFAAMPLLDYFDSYFTPIKQKAGMAGTTLDTMRQSIRWLAASLNRPALVSDLNDAALSRLWRFIKQQPRSQVTATWNTQRMVTLWRFAWKQGHVACGKPVVAALHRRHRRKAVKATIPATSPRRCGIPAVKERPPESLADSTLQTPLADFLRWDYATSHDITQNTIRNAYSVAVVSFERFLERPAMLADLEPRAVNAWIAALVETVSRETAHSYRRFILVLWRAAYDVGAGPEYPRRVRRIKRPQRIVEGYDTEQIAKLLTTADALHGNFPSNGIERRLWWVAFLLVAWNTGLRLGDLLAIQRSGIHPAQDGSARLSIVMQKTGRTIERILAPSTMAAIERLMISGPTREIVFPLWIARRDYYREFKALARSAGLPGTTKWIRSGSSSEVERMCPGAGRTHLGHRSIGLFEAAYKVERIIGTQIPIPPEPDFTPTLRIGYEPAPRKDGAA
jgi:integrase